jgi:hypothetical protein
MGTFSLIAIGVKSTIEILNHHLGQLQSRPATPTLLSIASQMPVPGRLKSDAKSSPRNTIPLDFP